MYHFSFFVSDNIHDNMLNCELNINLLASCKLSPVRRASSISSSCFSVASNIDTISSWVLIFLQCHLLQRIQSLHNSLYVIPDGLYGKAFPLSQISHSTNFKVSYIVMFSQLIMFALSLHVPLFQTM